MSRRFGYPVYVAFAVFASFAAPLAAQRTETEQHVANALDTMLEFCPRQVLTLDGGVRPAPEEFGLRPVEGAANSWEGNSPVGVLQAKLETDERRCVVHFASNIAFGLADGAIELIKLEGYRRLTGGTEDGVEASVWIRLTDDNTRRTQFIFLKNPNGNVLTVAFTEKAN